MQLLYVVCVSFGGHVCSAWVDRLQEAAWYSHAIDEMAGGCGVWSEGVGLIGGSLPDTSIMFIYLIIRTRSNCAIGVVVTLIPSKD